MNTITLTREKEKLSGQTFFDVKSGLIPHPLEDHVSCNFLYYRKDGKGMASFIFLSPKSNSIDSGWTTIDGHTEPIVMREGDVFVTPYGNYELYDTEMGLFPVSFRPYEHITDYTTIH